jgi:hypothetical protein
MEEMSIVRRRSRIVPILFALLVLAAIVVAALYVIGTGGVMNIGQTSSPGFWALARPHALWPAG